MGFRRSQKQPRQAICKAWDPDQNYLLTIPRQGWAIPFLRSLKSQLLTFLRGLSQDGNHRTVDSTKEMQHSKKVGLYPLLTACFKMLLTQIGDVGQESEPHNCVQGQKSTIGVLEAQHNIYFKMDSNFTHKDYPKPRNELCMSRDSNKNVPISSSTLHHCPILSKLKSMFPKSKNLNGVVH